MTVPVGKVFLESAMPTPLCIVYGCLYATTEELCSYKKLNGLKSLKYLLFGVLKKNLLATSVSAYMTGDKGFIFVSSSFFLSVVLVSDVILYV